MKNTAVIFFVITLSLLAFNVSVLASEPGYSAGTKRLIDSTVLEKKMTISVHLPESYSSANRSYPAIFMLGSEYKSRYGLMASTLDYLADQGQIPEFILIGIDLPDGNRVLLPDRTTGDPTPMNDHVEFLAKDLIPLVEKDYRLEPYRILFGASNSGFFTVYTLLHQPELFSAYFASSPSLGVAEPMLADKLKKLKNSALETNRHLYLIHSDDDSSSVIPSVAAFTKLLAKSKPAWLFVASSVRSNEGHVPAVDINFAFHSLFPDYNPSHKLESLQDITQHFQTLTSRYGYQIKPPTSILFDAGYAAIRDKNYVTAKKIFSSAIEIHPDWSRGRLGLGIVYRDQNDLARARELFSDAVNLDPDDAAAARLLKGLEGAKAP